jgi:hypothetical protein
MCLEQPWDPFFVFVAAAAGPAVRRLPPAVPSSERWSQTDSCECNNTNKKYTCDSALVVGSVRACVCFRALQLPSDGLRL